MMAAFFDINHRLHGPAAMIGIPSLPIAAVLLTIALRRSGELVAPPAWSMHVTWISFVLMGAAMMLLMRSLSQAGVDLSAQAGPLTALPAGVTPVVGWVNRLLIAAYMLWVLLTALPMLRHPPPPEGRQPHAFHESEGRAAASTRVATGSSVRPLERNGG
jgi:hypothetical protein